MEEVGKSFCFFCLRQGVIDFSLSIKNIDILTKFFAFKTRPKRQKRQVSCRDRCFSFFFPTQKKRRKKTINFKIFTIARARARKTTLTRVEA